MIDVEAIWEMRPKGDRETGKAAGSRMPEAVPRSPGSCCHGPLESLGAMAPKSISRPERLKELGSPPPTSSHPCTAASRPRSEKKSDKGGLLSAGRVFHIFCG